MEILYLGHRHGTSRHRADALERLGHRVHVVDPLALVPGSRILARLHHETGGLICARAVERRVLREVERRGFDLTWVCGGRYVGPELVGELRRRYGPVVNYNNDDPLGRNPLDRCSWALYRRAVPEYDLLVVRRDENVAEAYARGARRVMRIVLTADEVAHAPSRLTAADRARWESEVLFVGTWMPERGPFLAELLRRRVPLTLYGDRWRRAREWPILAGAWRGPGLHHDADYARAIQCARVCLGLLSKGNRDRHTRRSLEIPCLGGVLCAERTDEHLALYQDGEEALFWSDAAECASACERLLVNEPFRAGMARRGQERCHRNGHFNEPALVGILRAVFGEAPAPCRVEAAR